MCNGWDGLKEQYKAMKGQTYVIRNGSTGRFICNKEGNKKIFYSLDEAKVYIRTHYLSSIYCICPNEE